MKETHGNKTVVSQTKKKGLRTSFWIAKELGMDHESELFKEVLKGFEELGWENWPEDDMACKPFRMAKMPAYKYFASELEEETKQDSYEKKFESTSNAKKARASIQDIIQNEKKDETIVINNEKWHLAKNKVLAIEKHLKDYVTIVEHIKQLQVQYLSAFASLPASLSGEIDHRTEQLKKAADLISQSEIASLQICTAFSNFQPEDDQGLEMFGVKLDEHIKGCLELREVFIVFFNFGFAFLFVCLFVCSFACLDVYLAVLMFCLFLCLFVSVFVFCFLFLVF